MRVARPHLRPALLLALSLAAVSVAGCSHSADPAEEETLLVSVKAVTVVRETITATASVQGTVFAKREAVISTPVAGRLVGLELMQNRTVRAGEVLASIDAVDFFQAQKELRLAKATVRTTEALAARRRTLFEQGGIAKKELEETELALASAKEDQTAAERTVGTMTGNASVDAAGRAVVRAPFDGLVAEQLQSGGEFVSAGAPLFRLVDVSGLVVKAKFPDITGALLAEGSRATVEDEALGGEPVTGEISMVSRTTDPVTRTMEVWVRIDDPAARLRAGDSARVTASTRTAPDALVLPTEAVQLDASDEDSGVVMVIDAQGVAHETRVKVGICAGGKLQILEGLRGGEQVVTEGNYGLPDGTKVTVERAAAAEGSAADDQPAAKTAP